MTNKRHGTLYIGVTRHLAARALQHRGGVGSKYCKKYNLVRLVLVEPHETIIDAITREKAMKEWKRDWKIALIEATNPDWEDLFDKINC